ncbi:MAG: hypothetical protein A2341_11460 [Deltaproteobacteria bacterium RIFOXYB12_FULL_58_9]|nr:MAG: hypothetical protein A2341_11460 [Deltaproteobacteria bacterium RIFOXYB12_FULL_58_9]
MLAVNTLRDRPTLSRVRSIAGLRDADGTGTGDAAMYNLGVVHLGTPMRAWKNDATFVWAADTNGMHQRCSRKKQRGAAEHQPIARGCPQNGHRKDEAFGKAWEYLPESTSPPSIEVNLRFPGQYLDRETGLHYNAMRQRRSHKTLQGAAEHQPIARGCPQHGHRKDNWNRYYDPNTGRYLTPDPLAVRIPTHRDPIYSYAFSNPMRFTDPFGLYGTNDCSYYAERCAESGGAYYLLLRTGPVLV